MTVPWRSGLFALALLGLTVSQASAEPKKNKDPQYKQTNRVIKSVDAAAHTVTIDTQTTEVSIHHLGEKPDKDAKENSPHTIKTVTYTITSTTEIEVNNAKSTLDALHPGMNVSVTEGMDATVASRLSAH